jgi:hypothetical protein
MDERGRAGWIAGVLAAVVLASTGCGRVSGVAGTMTSAGATPSATASPGRLPLCNPAAADFQKEGMPTPAPCMSFNPEQQIVDNARPRDRRSPQPSDVAALASAAADLRRVFADPRARQVYDLASVQQAVGAYGSLRGASVHTPQSEKLWTVDPQVVVVLERASACLIGEHGRPKAWSTSSASLWTVGARPCTGTERPPSAHMAGTGSRPPRNGSRAVSLGGRPCAGGR